VRAIRNPEGTNVTDDSKDQGAEPRLEKAARETSHAGVPDYEITAQAIREKTARLRALRLARDAAEQKSAPPAPKRSGGRTAKKAGKASSVPLSQWLNDQKGSGHRS
jgi:hypothetical protein